MLCCLLVLTVQNLRLIIGRGTLSITSGREDMPTVVLGYNHPCWTVVMVSQRVSWARSLMSPWRPEVREGQGSTMDLHPGLQGDFPTCEMG